MPGYRVLDACEWIPRVATSRVQAVASTGRSLHEAKCRIIIITIISLCGADGGVDCCSGLVMLTARLRSGIWLSSIRRALGQWRCLCRPQL